ncbi:MAG: LacI family DNA-binding transcriptional regulator [Anaerolineae bacterium]|nr:LacI family DNA-binding transcriptional regulator [Anaerolineae bacterium]
MNKKPTIADIARAAGVSLATVSRILNNKPDVSEKTRKHVLAIIEEQGYTPQTQWQQIASGKSRTISMLYPRDYAAFNPLALQFIVGATEACEERNYFLNLITKSLTETSLLGMYRSGQTDGMIVMELRMVDWRVELLRNHQLPFVAIGHCEDNTGVSYVDLDFEMLVMNAVKHLFNMGHRNIGFISIVPDPKRKRYAPTVRATEGYQRAAVEYGLPQFFRETSMDTEDVKLAALSMLDEQPQITALITANDAAIAGVLSAIQALDLRIPEDISVIGLTTDQVAEIVTPSLTAFRFPSRSMGYQAGQILVDKLEGVNNEIKQILIQPELVIRGSTGPVRTIPKEVQIVSGYN